MTPLASAPRLRHLLVVLLVIGTMTVPRPASAATGTAVMGWPVLDEDQLVSWFENKMPKSICNRSTTVDGTWRCLETVAYAFRASNGEVTPRELIRLYLLEGAREGVRGDIAFVQAVHETAWFFFPASGQVRPTDNNFGGMGAIDGSDGRTVATFRSAQIGVRAQLQHLRGYADPTVLPDGSNLASPLESPRFSLIPPSNRGKLVFWEQYGGKNSEGFVKWASDVDYWPKISRNYSDALGKSGFSAEAAASLAWHFRLRNAGGGADRLGYLGASGHTPLACDWNGDGIATPGSFGDGRWTISDQINGNAVMRFQYGGRGDLPVCGDWNGDGRDAPGIVRDGEWHLRNTLTSGGATAVFSYGRITRGDVPIVGDWNGDGRDTPGIIRDGGWHLRNSLSGGNGQIVFTYGRLTRGDKALVGDWNGSGRDGPGIVRDGEWHLRNSLSGGNGQIVFTYGRVSTGDVPLMGDWNGDGRDTPTIVR